MHVRIVAPSCIILDARFFKTSETSKGTILTFVATPRVPRGGAAAIVLGALVSRTLERWAMVGITDKPFQERS